MQFSKVTEQQFNKQNVRNSFSWRKLLHNILYWTNPYYMLATDISKNPKALAFIDVNFGNINRVVRQNIKPI